MKLSGAGNDFIALDDRDGLAGPLLAGGTVREICRRGLSVGADGVLVLRPGSSPGSAFSMLYMNSDGSEAAMCGNGARCIAVYASMLGIVESGSPFEFESGAGRHRAVVTSDRSARVWTARPAVTGRAVLETDAGRVELVLVDSGVPHAVRLTAPGGDSDFERVAPLVRNHPKLAPEGANADYLEVAPDGSLTLRTWERGVEGETLACGTGALAAVAAARSEGIRLPDPAAVTTRGGLRLTVGTDGDGWWLEGEARPVFAGETLHPCPGGLTRGAAAV